MVAGNESNRDLHKSEIIEVIEPAAPNHTYEDWNRTFLVHHRTIYWKFAHRRWTGTTFLVTISRYRAETASIKSFLCRRWLPVHYTYSDRVVLERVGFLE